MKLKRSLIWFVLFLIWGHGTARAQMEEWRLATPQLEGQGKNLYQTNCVTCHGVSGQGDGPAGVAFNPRPRNFVEAQWKQGGTPSQLFKTLSDGLGSMPSFAGMPLKDRWALVHYIRTFNPNNPKDTPETIALLADYASQGAQAEIPVQFVIERIVQETTQ